VEKPPRLTCREWVPTANSKMFPGHRLAHTPKELRWQAASSLSVFRSYSSQCLFAFFTLREVHAITNPTPSLAIKKGTHLFAWYAPTKLWIQALTDAKLKSNVDLAFAKVDLARAKLLLLDAQDSYEASLSTLSAVLGYPERQDFVPVEPSFPVTPPAQDAAPLIQQALDLRPEVRSLRNEVLSAEKFGRAEHDLWWPTVSAMGVVGGAPVRDPNITSWYGAAGVNVNIPVFNGFLFDARIKSAELATQVQQNRLQDLQDNVASDVRNGWLDTQNAYERLSVTQQLSEQAELALELAQARYKLGLLSPA
jgi:outer membrane protein